MKKLFIYCLSILTIAVVAVSCNKSKFDGYKDTESGLAYKFYTQNGDANAAKPKEGDVMTISMSYRNGKDSILMDGSKRPEGIQIPMTASTFKGSLEEGFAMMAVGDSASFKVNADSLFLKTFKQEKLPPFVEKGSVVTFELKILKIQAKEEVQKQRDEAMQKQQAELTVAKAKELEDMSKYIADNKITVKPTPTGLIYIEKTKGKGKKAEKGKTVTVNYVGKFIDGTLFDTNNEAEAKKANVYQKERKYEPMSFPIGTGQVIPGFDEGIMMMSVGTKAQLIIPSSIGYGDMGGGPIKPFSTLVFDVELVDVK